MQKRYSIEVQVAQVDREPLHAMVNHFGVGKVAPMAVDGNSVPCSVYRICNWKDATIFLRRVAPYVIVKRPQVDLVLAYIQKREDAGQGWKTYRLSPEMHIARHELWEGLRALKHPGRLRSKVVI